MVHYSRGRRQSFLDKIFHKIIKLRLVIVCLLVVVGVSYFWQIISLSMRGFQIKSLDRQIQQLKKDNQKLELEITAAEAMMNLDGRIKELNLVAVQKIEFLNIVSPTVAMK